MRPSVSEIEPKNLILSPADSTPLAPVTRFARLKVIGSLIVDAELARTKVTDAGLKTLATFANLRAVDLAHTAVTSAGVPILARLDHLESLNLTATAVDDRGVSAVRRKQTLKRLYLFETKCTAQSELESRNVKP